MRVDGEQGTSAEITRRSQVFDKQRMGAFHVSVRGSNSFTSIVAKAAKDSTEGALFNVMIGHLSLAPI